MFTVAYDPKSVPWRSEEILEVVEQVRLVKIAKQGLPSLQQRLAEYVSTSWATLNLVLAPRF